MNVFIALAPSAIRCAGSCNSGASVLPVIFHLRKTCTSPLRMNDRRVLLICTGGGITNASTSIMALGQDPRFDLSKAYWLIAGIAGGDPLDVSLGTAAWSRHVVDGDLLYEIDAREMPKEWP